MTASVQKQSFSGRRPQRTTRWYFKGWPLRRRQQTAIRWFSRFSTPLARRAIGVAQARKARINPETP